MPDRLMPLALFLFLFLHSPSARAGCEAIVELAPNGPTMPWQWTTNPATSRPLRVLLTYFALPTGGRAMGEFIRLTRDISSQLKASRGLIGFSMQAKTDTNEFWTLSLWETDEDIQRFVAQSPSPHAEAMRTFSSTLLASDFIRWDVTLMEIPTTWVPILLARPRQ